jgi:NLI interacting factor-like phosphatase
MDCPESLRVVTTSDWNSPRIDDILKSQPSDPGRTAATILVRPLLVLDLNGILCHRIRRGRPPPPARYREAVTTVANTPIIPRSDLIPFLRMLQQHFSLAIWTSAKAKTASLLLKKLLPPELASTFLFVYAQHHCRAVPAGETSPSASAHDGEGYGEAQSRLDIGWDGYEKPVFEKDLSVVWESFPLWNANNTVLYDDSPEKCLQWQSNAIHPPPLTGTHLDDPVQEQQAALLRKLAEHWTNEPGVLVWEADGGDSMWFRPSHQSMWLREEVQKLRWDPSA